MTIRVLLWTANACAQIAFVPGILVHQLGVDHLLAGLWALSWLVAYCLLLPLVIRGPRVYEGMDRLAFDRPDLTMAEKIQLTANVLMEENACQRCGRLPDQIYYGMPVFADPEMPDRPLPVLISPDPFRLCPSCIRELSDVL